MKIMPTLEGGLKVDVETTSEWDVLMAITQDAIACDEDLSDRLGKLITDQNVADDWLEYIIPDLKETFQTELAHVSQAIQAARMDAAGEPGPLWIKREDGYPWYSALNQARLAIEERFHFGPSDPSNPKSLALKARSAWMRSQFYCAVQSMVLKHVLS